MTLYNFFYRTRSQPQHILVLFVLMAMVVAVTLVVWQTGGIKYVFSHSMYIPIALAGIIFGYKGGIFFGLTGGVALGPWMPIDTVTMELQQTLNWVYRTLFFLCIGILAGLSSDLNRRFIRKSQEESRMNPVSKLPNRKALLERLEQVVKRPKSRSKKEGNYFLVTCCIDNDMALRSAFGFAIIDTIIGVYADKLKTMSNYTPEVFHIYTGQVAALFPAVRDKDAETLMKACETTLTDSAKFQDFSVYVNRHLAGVRIDSTEKEPSAILQHAEIATACANENMVESFIYQSAISEGISEQLELMADLAHSIEQGHFSMHYQPKLHLSTGEVIGVEALIRWQHPTKGWISPASFIPIAERTTLILKISTFVLEEVIQQISVWQRDGLNLQVAINVSTHDLLQHGFCKTLFELLQKYDVPGELIELEITEGKLIKNIDAMTAKLLKLTKAKITVSIDDFGTGYSSLQYLYQLPISLLKIDQVFVRNLPADEGATHIVCAALVLSQKMGIKCLAEGIENAEILEYLRTLGCDYGQGYLFCKPLAPEDFVHWHKSYKPGTAISSQ